MRILIIFKQRIPLKLNVSDNKNGVLVIIAENMC